MDDCGQLRSGDAVVPADWNPIQAASSQSQFIAVLAGFVFIGMVYLLTQGQRRHRGSTVTLFMASFLCLAAGSYTTTLVSGEVTCLRAWSESMFSSGLVAVGTIAMLCGLVWLLPQRHGSDKLTRNFMLSSVFLITIVVIELLTTTARGFLLDLPIERHWRDHVSWYLLTALLVTAGWMSRHFPRSSGSNIHRRQRWRVAVAAFCVFGFAVVSLAFLGLIGDRPGPLWTNPAPWVMITTTLVPLTGAAVALIAVVAALPTAQTWADGPSLHTAGRNESAPDKWREGEAPEPSKSPEPAPNVNDESEPARVQTTCQGATTAPARALLASKRLLNWT